MGEGGQGDPGFGGAWWRPHTGDGPHLGLVQAREAEGGVDQAAHRRAEVDNCWQAMAAEPLFLVLSRHPEYQRHYGQRGMTGTEDGLVEPMLPDCREQGKFDPYAFTLTCEACHLAIASGAASDGDKQLHELLQKLQRRETQLLAAHLLLELVERAS